MNRKILLSNLKTVIKMTGCMNKVCIVKIFINNKINNKCDEIHK